MSDFMSNMPDRQASIILTTRSDFANLSKVCSSWFDSPVSFGRAESKFVEQ